MRLRTTTSSSSGQITAVELLEGSGVAFCPHVAPFDTSSWCCSSYFFTYSRTLQRWIGSSSYTSCSALFTTLAWNPSILTGKLPPLVSLFSVASAELLSLFVEAKLFG